MKKTAVQCAFLVKMESFGILPRGSDLSAHQLQFLDQNFKTHEDLLTEAPPLLSDLDNSCQAHDALLLHLHQLLTKRVVSWISRSFAAKSSLANLTFLLENLSLLTSQHGIGSRKIQKILCEELPQLARQLRKIERIRKYVDTALKLEALVGDLEDAVFCTGDHHARNFFSSKSFTSGSAKDFVLKQERLVQAIRVMNDIEDILVGIVKTQAQWCRLLESVDIRVDKALAVVRPQVLADHRALLASLGWPPKLSTSKTDGEDIAGIPNPLVLMEGDKRKYYSQSFLALCALQHLQTRREDRQHNIFGQNDVPMRLWAIDELISPIASRIEYHFSKWAEQPELMFTLVYKITRDFIVGVDDVLQPLIDKARLVSYSAKEAWVSAMVQMLSGFLSKNIFPLLAESYKEKHMRSEITASWLHLIDHVVSFDKQMQSLISSETGLLFEESERFYGLSRGLSVLMIFCDRPDWLKVWSKIELKDGWKKLKLELADERAWLIDKKSGLHAQTGIESELFLFSTREDYKAPLIAESALKIAREMIDRCQTLPVLLPRIQFIRSTAARFLWYFFNVLVLRCKNTEFLLNYPDDAVLKFCGSVNTARYVESKLQEWGDDVQFLEMRVREQKFNADGSNNTVGNSCFFAEEIKSLEELETNWLMELISTLLCSFETLSKDYWEYLHNKEYVQQEREGSTPDKVLSTADLAVSTDIVQALDTMKSKLCDLQTNLNPKDFLDLWRNIAEGIDHFISHTIFNADICCFSNEATINQFSTDMKGLFLVFQPFCVRPEAFFPFIKETVKVLKMSKQDAKRLQVGLANNRDGRKCLLLHGISHLSSDQVDKVLKSRKFTI